jgi:hypothetical protein
MKFSLADNRHSMTKRPSSLALALCVWLGLLQLSLWHQQVHSQEVDSECVLCVSGVKNDDSHTCSILEHNLVAKTSHFYFLPSYEYSLKQLKVYRNRSPPISTL